MLFKLQVQTGPGKAYVRNFDQDVIMAGGSCPLGWNKILVDGSLSYFLKFFSYSYEGSSFVAFKTSS